MGVSPGYDVKGVVERPSEEETASGAGEGERAEEPAAPQPVARVDTESTLAHPPFLNPGDLDSGVETGASVGAFVIDLAIFTPAAAAILRSSFSSRFRSFSLRLSCSSGVFCLARWVLCISRKRILWWWAYELVCSSYWATF